MHLRVSSSYTSATDTLLNLPWAACCIPSVHFPLPMFALPHALQRSRTAAHSCNGQDLRHPVQEEKQAAAKEVSQQPQPSHPPEQPPQQSENDAAAPPQRPLRRGQGEKYTDIPNSQVLIHQATFHS